MNKDKDSLKISKLVPHLAFKVWGGTKLKAYKAPKNSGVEPLGETWEVSRHPDGPSTESGGKGLRELFSESQLPYLVKLIDTADNLSVQVHPDDDYASKHENDKGKSECWLIIDSEPDCGIYLGLKEGVTRDQFKSAVEKNEAVNELLNFYEVSPGDFFFVPAGSIHALGNGVTLTEIQQSSGITYRVWDWNRLGMDGQPRELHVDKAMDVINFDKSANKLEHFNFSKDNFSKSGKLVEHRDFKVHSFILKKNDSVEFKTEEPRINSLLVLDGELYIDGVDLKKFESAILAKESTLKIQAKEKSLFIIIS